MKRSSLIFWTLFFFQQSISLNAQWIDRSSGIVGDQFAVHFPHQNRGWCAGEEEVYQSSDKGANWIEDSVPVDIVLNGVHFVDTAEGWAVGAFGTILHTDDGGDSWDQQNSGSTLNFRDVHFIDELNGVAVADGGDILRTSNGGVDWNTVYSFPDDIFEIQFVNDSIAWIAGRGGLVAYSMDTCTSWNGAYSGTVDPVGSVYFVTPSTGWVVGWDGSIRMTTDTGNTWILQKNTNTILKDLFMLDLDTGWAVGIDGSMFQTTDGGTTWYPKNSGTVRDLNDVYFANDSIGWVAGSGGTMLFYGDTAVGDTAVDLKGYSPEVSSSFQVSPNPARDRIVVNSSKRSFNKLEVHLYDLTGRGLRFIDDANGNETQIDVGSLKRGVYLVQIRGMGKGTRPYFTEKVLLK